MNQESFRRRASVVLGLIFSLFFLWLGFRGLELSELFDTLGDIEFAWVLIAIPVYFVAIYILTWRWYFLARPVKDVHPNRLWPIVVIGYMANNLLPFRLGEVLRAYVVRRHHGIPIAPTLTTILIERVFDGLAMLAFIFAALFFVDFEEPRLRNVILVTTPLFFGALLVFFWLAAKPERARRIYTPMVNTVLPVRLRAPLLDIANQLMGGLAALRSWRALLLVILFTLWSWTVEASTYWIVMQAFDFGVSFYVLLLVVGFGNLATILPSTAGYIGTFHAVAILTLVAFEVDRTVAASYAIVMHATLWGPITLAGFLYFLQQGLRWRDIDTAQEVVHEAEDSNTTTRQDITESEAIV
ncbi:MAG: flippase-like domain-containing protein [Chloroflexi bacterium]|nr:flippase-like domain-containing protein [Chloroflexota bacterium]